MKLNLELIPRHPGLLAGHDNDVEVMVRLSGPELEESRNIERSPINLGIVIDRSGSMRGQPLTEANRSACYIVDRLSQYDYVSVVSYDSDVQINVPAQKATDKQSIKFAIESIQHGGSTNLHGGWLAGAEQVARHDEVCSVNRVLLLSDGCANAGLTDLDAICDQVHSLAKRGITTSTYGLGAHFQEMFMVQMAKAGGGNSYYGQLADDLMDPIIEEFDLLRSLIAQQVRLAVSAHESVQIELLNDFSKTPTGWTLPDVASVGDVWSILRLRIPSNRTGQGNGELIEVLHNLVVSYCDLEGETHQVQIESFKLPSLPPSAWKQVASDEVVQTRLLELEAARLQREARRAARQRDWRRVDALLLEARQKAGDNDWIKDSLDSLERYATQREMESFAKEAMYKSEKMSSRKVARNESFDPSMDSTMASYLQRKSEQGKKR